LYPSGEFLRRGPDESGMCYRIFYESKCIFGLGNMILWVPNALRVAQCLRKAYTIRQLHPDMTNAVKYMLKVMVTWFSLLHSTLDSNSIDFWLLLIVMLVHTLYSQIWDMTEDWGLFQSSRKFLCLPCGTCCFRKNHLISSNVWFYIRASSFNFLARSLTIVNFISPSIFSQSVANLRILGTIMFWAPYIEICRRTMWSVLKYENKQITQNLASQPAAALEAPQITERSHPLRRMQSKDEALGTKRKSFRHMQVEFTLFFGAVTATIVWMYATRSA